MAGAPDPARAGDTVATLYAAYNAGDADRAASLYAPSGRHVEVATAAERTGRRAIADGLGGLLEAFPDAHWREQTRIVSGDRAAVTYVLTGTLQSRFGPFEPSGQRLELRGVHVVQLGRDGIELCEDFWDAATFGRQMRQGG
jgi:ketosteroid isomerase-like protein